MVTLQLHRILLLQVRGLLKESLCLFYPFLEQVKGRWLTSFLSTYFMRQGDGVATSGNANIATRAYRLLTPASGLQCGRGCYLQSLRKYNKDNDIRDSLTFQLYLSLNPRCWYLTRMNYLHR
jgi:hypothetical protein